MKKMFCGIFAKDEFKTINKNVECAYIANTDISENTGEHWILVYVEPQMNQIIFCDSYAKSPLYYGKEFVKWVNVPGLKIIQNLRPVQNPNSIYCGLFVLYYYYHLARGMSLHDVNSNFFVDTTKNDQVIIRFFWKTFKYNVKLQTGGMVGKMYKRKFWKDFSHLKTKNKC